MNVLVLASAAWNGTAVPCTFTATAGGVDLELTTFPVTALLIPDGTDTIEVTASPTTAAFFDAAVTLVVTAAGEAEPVVTNIADVATTSVTAAGITISRATITVSRVRDVSTKAREQLDRLIPIRHDTDPVRDEPTFPVVGMGDFPPEGWTIPDRPSTRFVDVDQPIDGRALHTVVRSASGSDCEHLVLEVAGVKVPQVIAVSWPHALLRDNGADPTPFLVYYRPSTGQNVKHGYYQGAGLDAYPWNFDFCYFGMYQFQWYADDPLTGDMFSKGIPFQVAAAGKNVVTVIPCNKPVAGEFGAFLDAAAMETILLEVQALMFRRAGATTPPATLGRTALGAFSSGNDALATVLQSVANRKHRFFVDTVKEIYFFDPAGFRQSLTVAAALTWAGGADDRRIALYAQAVGDAGAKLLGGPVPVAPYVESPTPLRTVAALPPSTWRATLLAAAGVDDPQMGFDQAHQLIPALMLTHAMATSGF